jgi:hypothetical protein
MSLINRSLVISLPLLCLCTHPICLNMQVQSRETMAGYYLSEECHECAGLAVGSLVEELALNEDSTFILSHLAVRWGFNDIITTTKLEGKWRMVKGELRLRPFKYEKTEVDSIYNPLPKKNIFIIDRKEEYEMKVSFCRKSKDVCSSRCSKFFTKQENRPYRQMERH